MMSEYQLNWLLMGVGLVLMIGPWILYFILRNKEREKEPNPGKESERN